MENILINGDCLEVLKDIPDKSVDMILIDPPYLMNYQSGHRKTRLKKIANDDCEDWIEPIFSQFNRLLKDNASMLFFCNEHSISQFLLEANKYFTIKKPLIWIKNNWSAGDLVCDFGCRTEYILHFQKGRNPLRGKRDTNCLYYNRTLNKLHPTEKPIDLLEYLISKLSDEEAIILDCFMGSGSTCLAAKNTNRKYIGIELDKEYFEIAQKRLA